MKRLMMFCLLMLCLCSVAFAAEYTVNPAGGGDYASLTEALAAVEDGDVLLLAGGVYDQSRETFPILVEKRVTIAAVQKP